ncbi:MAG: glutathione S-transferase family protein [Hyphomicrobiaceae bacterium]
MPVDLHGYKYSVYAWIARFVLHEKGVDYRWVEVDPFADDVSADYLAMHPFCRVPTLADGDFVLYETGAITRYIDEAFEGPALQPGQPRERARMCQIISIVDSYAYWPLVRQVFSHGFFGPRMERTSDPAEFRQGLEAAPRVLGALEGLAGGGPFLIGDAPSLADLHLAPMIAYFVMTEDGRTIFDRHERLQTWWRSISGRSAFAETKPDLTG